ncbi:hypothetical protein LTR78_001812 [Recurvomyces mirabilis]|uniref:Uncharacterized protein n=1 Tax=Recurvomyces mirabilis TaxID=574656 RepID=A0AAE1C546_9PEZI|nr:hypothetical protein LTR78_001812 [Recurvomyces mirabilis]KAK5156747.1 hypothetical protein LTS14_004960 [Recurvomyces mirabilis]
MYFFSTLTTGLVIAAGLANAAAIPVRSSTPVNAATPSTEKHAATSSVLARDDDCLKLSFQFEPKCHFKLFRTGDWSEYFD